jgi:nucleoid-associated protein YgaU
VESPPSVEEAPSPEEAPTPEVADAEPASEATPHEEAQAEAEAEAEAGQGGRGRGWRWAAIVLGVAAIVGTAIGINLGGRQNGPLTSQATGTGRPTILVATAAAAAPSSVPAVASPSAVPSTVVAGVTASAAASSEYVVQPGDTLQSIAEEQYGDAGEWPKIYQANRDAIGPNPDALVAGTTLELPPP